ncbi:MAG: DUF4435 domain-containing protein [Lachnospiraceae bacterium]|nr:DUF4435 domain-containing protein [Lachnospiraceae bacterium]
MDSIREYETLEDVITTLRMELSNDLEGKLSIVLVEGEDDISFVNRIFEKDVVCFESPSGKEGVRKLVEAEDIADCRIIGIRDRDYESVEGYPPRLFCYDTCCLETMLLSCEGVVEGIHAVYYKGSMEQGTFIMNAMRQLAPLSMLREKNERYDFGINFQRAALSEFVSKENESITYGELFSKLGQSQEMLEDCRQEAGKMQDCQLLDKTNGHDICRFLGKILKSGKGDLGEKRLREILICSYRTEDFRNTYLYQKLSDYQQRHQLCYVE